MYGCFIIVHLDGLLTVFCDHSRSREYSSSRQGLHGLGLTRPDSSETLAIDDEPAPHGRFSAHSRVGTATSGVQCYHPDSGSESYDSYTDEDDFSDHERKPTVADARSTTYLAVRCGGRTRISTDNAVYTQNKLMLLFIVHFRIFLSLVRLSNLQTFDFFTFHTLFCYRICTAPTESRRRRLDWETRSTQSSVNAAT